MKVIFWKMIQWIYRWTSAYRGRPVEEGYETRKGALKPGIFGWYCVQWDEAVHNISRGRTPREFGLGMGK